MRWWVARKAGGCLGGGWVGGGPLVRFTSDMHACLPAQSISYACLPRLPDPLPGPQTLSNAGRLAMRLPRSCWGRSTLAHLTCAPTPTCLPADSFNRWEAGHVLANKLLGAPYACPPHLWPHPHLPADSFKRWEAGHVLAKKLMRALYASAVASNAGTPAERFAAAGGVNLSLVDAYRSLLNGEGLVCMCGQRG